MSAPSTQAQAPSADLDCVAVYDRTIEASLELVWENVLDWEHLPWLHARSFASLTLLAEGDWGWRANIEDHDRRVSEVELVVYPERGCYVARTLSGSGRHNEVWTSLRARTAHETVIRVEFFVPTALAAAAKHIGDSYVAAYRELWDEDEEMMQAREVALARGGAPSAPASLELGSLAALRVALPTEIELGGDRFRLVDRRGEIEVLPTVCPHRGGPLSPSDDDPDRLECPWHGYAFDRLRGESCDGRGLRLPACPIVIVDAADDTVRIELPKPARSTGR